MDEQRILDDRPELGATAMLCLEYWHKLDSERYPGPHCSGPIPRSAITNEAERDGIDRELASVIADVLHGLDVKRSTRISSELELQQRKGKGRR